MRRQTYNNETMTAYLLGALPEAEAEQLDELSFTDDDFADELAAAEKDLVDAYVHGELPDATLEKFKSYYLASPLRRKKVEFAQAFQTFAEKSDVLQTAVSQDEIPAAAESKPKQSFAGFFSNIFTASRPSLQWGFAVAALAFLIFGGWLFVENSRLRNLMNETQARRAELQQREKELQGEIANQRTANSEKEEELTRAREELARLEKQQETERKRLAGLEQERKRLAEQERAETPKQTTLPKQLTTASFVFEPQLRRNELQTISIPAQTDSAAMQLKLESDDYAAYRVVLRNQANNQIIWRSGKLKTRKKGENKSLNISFPANLLKSQIYSLEVSGISADGTSEIIGDYSFRVVR